MDKHIIIGAIGHLDHSKTNLATAIEKYLGTPSSTSEESVTDSTPSLALQVHSTNKKAVDYPPVGEQVEASTRRKLMYHSWSEIPFDSEEMMDDMQGGKPFVMKPKRK